MIFVALAVIREPNSHFAAWVSLFPPATPMLMIARQAVPPGIALWQPLVGIMRDRGHDDLVERGR